MLHIYDSGRFINNQQKCVKLIQVFTMAWKKNTERKKKKGINLKIIASKLGKNMSMVCRTEPF